MTSVKADVEVIIMASAMNAANAPIVEVTLMAQI